MKPKACASFNIRRIENIKYPHVFDIAGAAAEVALASAADSAQPALDQQEAVPGDFPWNAQTSAAVADRCMQVGLKAIREAAYEDQLGATRLLFERGHLANLLMMFQISGEDITEMVEVGSINAPPHLPCTHVYASLHGCVHAVKAALL